MKSTHSQFPWLDCGLGTLLHPVTGRPITTRVIEAQGFGRILEVYDYSNEPEQNFNLILVAPDMRALLNEAQEAIDTLAGDADEAGYPARAQNATELAMRIRSLIAKA